MSANSFEKVLSVFVFALTSFLCILYASADTMFGQGLNVVCKSLTLSHGRFWGLSVLLLMGTSTLMLFLGRMAYIARHTRRWIAPIKENVIEVEHPVIREFQARRIIDVDVIHSDQILACSYGLVKPRILITMGQISLLSRDELLAILEHEYRHCRNRDPLRVLFAYSVRWALFFIPMIKVWTERFFLEKEIEADQAAITNVGLRPLAVSLYKSLTIVQNDGSLPLALSLNELVSHRIDFLMQGTIRRNPISVSTLVVSLVSILILVVVLILCFM